MRLQFLHIILFLLTANAYSQKEYAVTFHELPIKMMEQPRPIVVKIYTDWCGICKIQDKQIEKDAELRKLLKEDFYYLELNAESLKPIVFNNKTYRFIPYGPKSGIHELAKMLCASGGYPCWVIVTPGYQAGPVYNGLLKSRELKNNLLLYKNNN